TGSPSALRRADRNLDAQNPQCRRTPRSCCGRFQSVAPLVGVVEALLAVEGGAEGGGRYSPLPPRRTPPGLPKARDRRSRRRWTSVRLHRRVWVAYRQTESSSAL